VKRYALEENVNGRNPPRPVEIRCVENGTVRSESWVDAAGKLLPPFLVDSRQFKIRPIAINVSIGGLHQHTQRHLNKHCNHSFYPLRLLSNLHAPRIPTAMSATKTKAKGIINAHHIPFFSKSFRPYCKPPKTLLNEKLGSQDKTSCCNSTRLRTALRCRAHWRRSPSRGVCRIFFCCEGTY